MNPPHQDLRCLQIQLFSSLVVKELSYRHYFLLSEALEPFYTVCLNDDSYDSLSNFVKPGC